MTKQILLVVPGAGDESTGYPVVIEADTTVADLLNAANLNAKDYLLQVQQGEQRISLQSQDRVADHVQAGDKVFAMPSNIVVGLTL